MKADAWYAEAAVFLNADDFRRFDGAPIIRSRAIGAFSMNMNFLLLV